MRNSLTGKLLGLLLSSAAMVFSASVSAVLVISQDDVVNLTEDQTGIIVCPLDNDNLNGNPPPLTMNAGYYAPTAGYPSPIATVTQVNSATCATAQDPDNPGANVFNAFAITLVPNASGTYNGLYYGASDGDQNTANQDHTTSCNVIGNNTQSCGSLLITVSAVDDPAVITGTLTGIVTEDAGPNQQAGANLDHTDIDNTDDQWTPASLTGKYGALTINAAGVWLYTLSDADADTEALDGGASVSDETFLVSTSGGTTTTITITVNGANDGPTGVDDSNSVGENATLNVGVGVGVIANDTDVDASASLTVSAVTGGSVGSQFALPSGALLTLNANGSYIYDPNGQFEDEASGASSTTDSFTYTLTDGTLTDTATATITIVGENDPPTDISMTSQDVNENAGSSAAVGAFSTTDVDTSDTHSYALVGGTGSTDNGAFSITGGNILRIVDDPNYEGPKNTYSIRVQTSDGQGGTYSEVFAISVNDLNDVAPVITSGNSASVPENTTAVLTVTSTETDTVGSAHVYAITGAGDDDAAFSIVANSGVLTFSSAPNFENPTDVFGVAADNIYQVEVSAFDGANTTTQLVTVTVTNALENAPVITSDGGLATAAINVTEGNTGVTTVAATDGDAAEVLTYSITGGLDAADFNINGSSGALTFAATPNFEAPADSNTDNDYVVEVTVTDLDLNTDVQTITVTVDNDAETAPVITSDGGLATAALNVTEGNTVVTTVTATDADAADTQTYSITGGLDAADFSINASSGALTFVATPNFEAPADSNTDNDYIVEVTVTDLDSNTDIQTITVTVDNDAETAPVITSDGGLATATLNVTEGNTAVTTVTATDVDVADTQTYSISGGLDAADFSINASSGALTFAATPNFEAPADSNTDNDYVVEVTVTDLDSNTDVQTITVTVDNSAETTPVITSDGGLATAAINVTEGNTGVTTVAATDGDAAEVLTYSITGGLDAADFNINGSSGALTFAATPNFEAPADSNTDNDYVVEVTVTDLDLNTDVQTITVTVDNDAETAPVITSDGGLATAALNVTEGNTVVTTVTATDADAADTQTYSITGGLDAADFSINASSGALTFVATPNFEAPADSNTDNDYIVEVTVTDLDSNTDIQTITVTVDNDAETAPVITSDGGLATAALNVTEGNTAVTTVTATDVDVADTQTYSISGGLDAADFSINASSGALTFAATPNFEAPADSNTDNDYVVEVTVTDLDSNTDVQTITVTVDNSAETTPVITSDGGLATAAINVTEGNTGVTTVAATDGDAAEVLTYSITGGLDAADFNINGSSGALTFAATPNFEAPADSNTDNDYVVEVTVTDLDLNTDVQTITVTVDNDAETAPVITSDGGLATATLNVTEGNTVVTTVTATDADAADTQTYSITGGLDAADFSINASSGALTFVATPNFEAPADSNTDNDYIVEVTVTDLDSNTDIQTITVTVDNDAETAPVITSDGGLATAALNVTEGNTAVTTVTATDVDVADTQTYSITGGLDAADFSINASSGALTFAATPNFEAPADSNTDNDYVVEVTVTDLDSNTDVQTITVTVDNSAETTPVITSDGGLATAAINVTEGNTGVTTVAATDGDAAEVLTYSITGGLDAADFNINGSSGALTFAATPNFEAPADSNTDNDYVVEVTVTDLDLNTDVQTITVTVDNDAETAPVITSDGGLATAALNVTEGNTVVTTVTATDADAADTQTYSITGGLDAADFSINASSGALTFVATPNFEAPADSNTDNDYIVEVTVTDLDSNTDIQTITVTVDNDAETAPVITSDGGLATAALNVTEGNTAVTTVTATDVDVADTQTYSISGGLDAADFSINASSGALTFAATPNFEAPADSNTDNDYVVEVTVTDLDSNTDVQTITVTVDNSAETTPVITSDGGLATAALNVTEGNTGVTTVSATDPDSAEVLTYSMTGGLDVDDFSINSSTGVLEFSPAPNFEIPTDSNGDNDYEVEITVTDLDGNTDIQTITVTVDNDLEISPSITSNGGGASAAVNVAENTTPVTTIVASDPNLGLGDVLTFSLSAGADQAKFGISKTSASTADLTFLSAPNFEAPTDTGDTAGNNTYVVVVSVTDIDGNVDTQTLTVTVTNDGESAPVITSDSGGATAALNVTENTTAVTTVTATDVDVADSQTYSISGGADSGRFTINASSGVLAFSSAPNFESPLDANTDNDYVVEVTVTDKDLNTDTQTITVTVDNDGETTPVITSNGGLATGTDSIVENTTAVTTVAATDPDAAEVLSFTITGGADQGLFTLNALSGALAFSSAPNFEAPADTGDTAGNNTYVVEVTATDLDLNTDVQTLTVTVTNASETTPVITSNGGGASGTDSIVENTTAVTTVAATDPDAAEVLSYTITGGADQGLFTLDVSSGALAFSSAPNFEAPTDTGDTAGNNTYVVIVTVTDLDSNTDVQTLTVTVTNDGESAPVITSDSGGATAALNVTENTTAVTTVTATDVDVADSQTYSISGGADSGRFTINASSGVLAFSSAPNFESPLDANTDNDYVVEVTVTDKDSNTDTQTITVTVDNDGETTPVITSNGGLATGTDSIVENTTAVTTVAATDPDAAEVLSFTITGGADQGLFTLNASSGALAFSSAPNFEAPADTGDTAGNNTYVVEVTATDLDLNTDVQTLTVTVTNASETTPVITSNGGGASGTDSIVENTTAVTTVAATDPDAAEVLSYTITGGADQGLFTLDASSGALAFSSAPNFEAPTDTGDTAGNNTYVVIVTVTDLDSNTDVQTLTVTVTNDGESAPVITSDSGGATAALNVTENTTAVTTVTATDVDVADSQTYSISGGADSGRFTINASSGVLAFSSAPNFESPLDANTDNDYVVEVTVTDKDSNTDTQTITVTVDNDGETTPVITSNGGLATGTDSIVENTTAVTTVAATDPDAAEVLSFTITGGADQGLFTLNASSGALAFSSAPNFEAPADTGDTAGNNTYVVEVTATDLDLNTDVQTLTVTVTNASETTPVITSNGGGASGTDSIVENTTAVTTVAATDPDAAEVLSYTITGGADQGLFTLDVSSGALAFSSAPNFEAPTDTGDTAGNNTYVVIVTVTDLDSNTDVQTLTVTVTNDGESAPVITSDSGGATAALNVTENTTAVTTVTATDVDVADSQTYSISGGADSGRFTINASSGVLAFSSAPNFESPLDANTDNDYVVEVTVTDKDSNTDTQTITVTVDNDGETTPVITSNGGLATGTDSIVENTTAVTTVAATDPDAAEVLSFTITGGADQGLFTLNASSGALAFSSAPNFEAPADTGDTAGNNTYVVEVTATDLDLNTDVQTLTVTVTNASETTPVITSNGGGASGTDSIVENTTAVTTVAATDPDAAEVLSYTITGGADQGLFTLNASSGALAFSSAPDFEAPTDSDTDGDYLVEVTVTDLDLNTDAQSLTISVTDENDNAPVFTTSTIQNLDEEGATTVVLLVTTDADTTGANPPGFTIVGGVDQGDFTLAGGNTLTFVSTPNFEVPLDANVDNDYVVDVRADDGVNTTDLTITVTVNNINETPVITSNGGAATASISLDENVTAVTTVVATDVDAGDTQSYSVSGGSDSTLFSVNAGSGALTFNTAPDFEAPADANADNVYVVEVTVTDSGGLTDTQEITITISDANEAPTDIAMSSQDVDENSPAGTAVGNFTATDSDLADTHTYSFVAGAGDTNNGSFQINGASLETAVGLSLNYEVVSSYEVRIRATDSGTGNLTYDESFTISVNNKNEAPAVAVPASSPASPVLIEEDVSTVISGISVGDIDADIDGGAGVFVTVSITENSANAGDYVLKTTSGIVVSSTGGSLRIPAAGTDSVTNVNAALASLEYEGSNNYIGTATLNVLVDDDGNTSTGNVDANLTSNKNVFIDVYESNDPPTMSDILDTSTDEDTDKIGISFSVDEGASDSDNQNLTITATSSDTTLVPNSNITINFSEGAGVDASLLSPTIDISPAADLYGTTTITVTVVDDGGGALSVTDTFVLTVDSVNDAPVATVPGAQTLDEDVQTAIIGISIVDVDADDAAGLSAEAAVSNGLLNVTASGAALVSNNDTDTVTVTGTVSDVTSTLNSLLYTSDADYSGAETLTVTVDDLGNTGSGGTLTDVETVAITVSAVNDDPVITAPASETIVEDTQTAVAGLSIADVDADVGGGLSVTLAVADGVLNVTAAGSALVTNNDTASVVISGTVVDVANTMGTAMYTPDTNFNGTDTLTITANDGGNSGSGGGGDVIDTVTLDVTAVNDAPVWTVPGAQTVDEDVPAAIPGSSVVDVDADDGSAPFMTLTLAAANGTLSVTASGSANVTNNGSASVTVDGTVDDVSATAGTMIYTTDQDYNGADVITLTANDGGNTGTGGGANVQETINVTITPVNDAPVIGDLSAVDENLVTNTIIEITVDEGVVDITNVPATDVDGDTIYYRIPVNADTVGHNAGVNDTRGDSTYNFEILGSGDLTFTLENFLQSGVPDCEPLNPGADTSADGDCTFDFTVEVYDFNEPGTPSQGVGTGNSDTIDFQVTVNDVNDAPGEWVCETFVGGVDQGTVDPRYKFVNGVNNASGVILTFAEDDPGTEAREDCRRVLPTVPLYEMTQGEVLNGYARSVSDASGQPVDVPGTTNFESPLLYKYGLDIDQDHYSAQTDPLDIDLDNSAEVNYFNAVTVITQLGASVAFTNLAGDRPDSVVQSGGFVYTPPANLATKDGADALSDPDFFVYRVCDATSTTSENNCALGIVEVNIAKAPPTAVDSEDAVTFIEELSQAPLELPVPAIPNVMVLFDDTADGMQTDILTNMNTAQEATYGITDDNDQVGSEGKYIYGNDLKSWIMPYKLGNRNDYLPDEVSDPGKGLWRVRSPEFNKLYYDPAVTYNPWTGLDGDGLEYADVDPTNAPDNPYAAGRFYDLTAPQSLGGGGGGGGKGSTSSTSSSSSTSGGGTSSSSSSSSSSSTGGGGGGGGGGLYLPYYWTWTDSDSDGYVDLGEKGTKIEILSGSTYAGGADRTDCVADAGAPNTCTYAEELQNFANWYSYYRSRGLASKGGLGAVIAGHDDLRVGFAEFNGQSNVIGAYQLNESPTTGHKADVLEKLYATADSSGNNNMRTALQRTGNYFECGGQAIVTEAQNKAPGDAGCPVLAAPIGNCQHNFALVISAGFWGGTSPKLESDSDEDTEFDGGKFASTVQNTLADVAMYYYENDLHPDLDDEVPTAQRDLDGVPEARWNDAFGGADGLVETMHQNMRTYIIGFGAQGDISFDTAAAADAEAAFSWGDPTTSDTDKLNDLVHAALNGRGAYLDAGNPVELNEALEAAFNEFSTFVGTATAVASNAEEILVGSVIYRASYNISDGSGQLVSQEISLNADGLVELGGEVWSAAAELDNTTFDDRVIITFDPDNYQGVPFRYANLTYAQASAIADVESCTEVDFNADSCSAGFVTEVTNHLNWFRGDATNERPAGNLRERPEVEGKMGDIVNSTPTFYGAPSRTRRNGLTYPQTAGFTYAEFLAANASREGIVYLAANDGMLHAFNGDTGNEEFAYIPNTAITGVYNNKIKGLLDFNYVHEYVHDLSPAIEDVFIDTTGSESPLTRNWTTALLGGLGAGGKGYYLLDITDPVPAPTGLAESSTSTIADMVLWEFTVEDDTYPSCERPTVDSCAQDEALVDGANAQLIDGSITPSEPYRDLGFSLSLPTIAMSNLTEDDEQEWVAVFGNGYNSSSGRAKLYVLRLERGIDGEWCHADQVFDGNEDNGDPWDYQATNKVCPDGDDFVKIEAAGPILSTDVDGDGVYDVADGDQVSANGLGTPRAIDVDRNGTLDYAYAGDRFGNFYRFDLTSDDETEWTAEVIFHAEYDESVSGFDANTDGDTADVFDQPITTRPFAVQHPTASAGADCNPDPAPGAVTSCGGFIIIFATGSYVYDSDGTSKEIQSIYGIWERFQTGVDTLITKDDLVEQTYTFLDANQLFRELSSNTVDYSIGEDGASPARGYYIDLDTPGYSSPATVPFAGEKAIRNIQAFAGAIFVNSVIPKTATSCTNEAGGAQNTFCPDTGGLECLGGSPIFDINNDGVFDSQDLVSGTVPASLIIEDGVPTDSTFIGRSRLTQLSDQSFQATLVNPATTDSTGRLSWKQLESTSQ